MWLFRVLAERKFRNELKQLYRQKGYHGKDLVDTSINVALLDYANTVMEKTGRPFDEIWEIISQTKLIIQRTQKLVKK